MSSRIFLTPGALLPSLLGVCFVVAIVIGSRLPRGAGHSAVALGSVGLVILIAYVIHEARLNWLAHNSSVARNRAAILDLSSETLAMDQRVVWERTFRVLGGMGLLFVGIWLASFHLAVPIYVGVYLRRWAQSSWTMVITTALVFEFLIVVFYGLIIRVPWGSSVLESALGFTFQGLLGAPLEPFLPSFL